ncbi:hypothetical protein L7F22_047660 [Adiantum nelumboides]|nr:hypothetical protein [Adiantum nelumboides]
MMLLFLDTRGSSSLNVLMERVKQNNMVDPLPIFLPIIVIERPPMDPNTGKRPLEVRAVIDQHVLNLKYKMKNKANAIVLPLLVLVDRQQCPSKDSWVKANIESYTYWVLGGTHLLAKQALVVEYEHVDTYKMAMCWVYAGLTDDEAKGKLKGQKLSKSHAPSRSKGASKEDSRKPILEDMKITPWRPLQGIHEKSLIVVILSRVKGGSISLEQMGEEFERQKTMLHMQRIMIEKLNCSNWDELVHYHPDTSKPHVLEKYMLLFANTVSCSLDSRIPRVEEMDSFVTPYPYTLAITDAPYGFCAPNSINDDVKYGVPAYKMVKEDFGKVTTCDSWLLAFFHVHDQITATQKAFTDSNMTCQMLTWVKPNIHGYKLNHLSWALGTGTTIVSTLKRGRNVVPVECDSLQVRFIKQRVTALKELPYEFQEVGMKSMAFDPRFFDASREPQPPIGNEKVGEIVDLVDFDPDNVEVEEQVGDTPLQITSLGEKMRNEKEEELPIQE